MQATRQAHWEVRVGTYHHGCTEPHHSALSICHRNGVVSGLTAETVAFDNFLSAKSFFHFSSTAHSWERKKTPRGSTLGVGVFEDLDLVQRGESGLARPGSPRERLPQDARGCHDDPCLSFSCSCDGSIS